LFQGYQKTWIKSSGVDPLLEKAIRKVDKAVISEEKHG